MKEELKQLVEIGAEGMQRSAPYQARCCYSKLDSKGNLVKVKARLCAGAPPVYG
jgi:hypothetical protein